MHWSCKLKLPASEASHILNINEVWPVKNHFNVAQRQQWSNFWPVGRAVGQQCAFVTVAQRNLDQSCAGILHWGIRMKYDELMSVGKNGTENRSSSCEKQIQRGKTMQETMLHQHRKKSKEPTHNFQSPEGITRLSKRLNWCQLQVDQTVLNA